MKQSGCKDQEELEEDNEELFAELGTGLSWYLYTRWAGKRQFTGLGFKTISPS